MGVEEVPVNFNSQLGWQLEERKGGCYYFMILIRSAALLEKKSLIEAILLKGGEAPSGEDLLKPC